MKLVVRIVVYRLIDALAKVCNVHKEGQVGAVKSAVYEVVRHIGYPRKHIPRHKVAYRIVLEVSEELFNVGLIVIVISHRIERSGCDGIDQLSQHEDAHGLSYALDIILGCILGTVHRKVSCVLIVLTEKCVVGCQRLTHKGRRRFVEESR